MTMTPFAIQPDAARLTTIVVVGFPKSGNTWLARLIADACNAPVHERLIDNHIEFASDVNGQLRQPTHPTLRVAKVHDLPETFADRAVPGRQRFVYVHRDPRDVAVSAFFHFTRWEDARIRTLFEQGPSHVLQGWRLRRARRAIARFVHQFTRHGIPRLERKLGRWDRHVQAWRMTDSPVVSVGYEQLLTDTPGTLARVIAALRLEGAEAPDIVGAAARQSFDSTRRQFEQAQTDDAVPLGKRFGLRFMRRGVMGDWRTYLSRADVDQIRGRFAETFNQLGYNRGWHESGVAETLEAA
jgi:hypothetical protein